MVRNSFPFSGNPHKNPNMSLGNLPESGLPFSGKGFGRKNQPAGARIWYAFLVRFLTRIFGIPCTQGMGSLAAL